MEENIIQPQVNCLSLRSSKNPLTSSFSRSHKGTSCTFLCPVWWGRLYQEMAFSAQLNWMTEHTWVAFGGHREKKATLSGRRKIVLPLQKMVAAALTLQMWCATQSLRVFVLHYWNVYSLSEWFSKLAALHSNTLLTERSPGKYSDTRRICISETARSFFCTPLPLIRKNGSLFCKRKKHDQSCSQQSDGCFDCPPKTG